MYVLVLADDVRYCYICKTGECVCVCVCFRFEKYTRDGNTMYATVGYLTAYSYYAYPANIRPRLRSVPHLMANAHSDQA